MLSPAAQYESFPYQNNLPINKESAMSFFRLLKKYFPVILAALSSVATVVLTVLCMSKFESGFLYEHAIVIASVAVGVEIVYVTAMFVCLFAKKDTVFKLLLTGIVLAAFLLLILFIMQATGLMSRIDDVEDLRGLIDSTGAWAPIVFIILQILQVCLLPIPGVLTVGAGVLAFGEWQASLYSFIGILIGSVIAFAVGRVVGYKAAAWMVGKDTLDKWLLKLKGKSNVILTAMFLLPMFPDDVLCFVSGLSAMSWKYFIIMQIFARAISVITTSFSLGGSIIPYTTWWGILIWICIGIAVIALFIFLYKKGDKIENWFFSLFSRKNKEAGKLAKSEASGGTKPAPDGTRDIAGKRPESASDQSDPGGSET